MRIAIALLCPFFLAATASAGPIQSLAFHFANDGSPAYRYVSGDILFEATAELAGSLVLDYDTVSGNDTIRQIEGRLDSPLQILGHYPVEMSWLAGADLEAEVPGLFDGMTGMRTGPLEFVFSSPSTAHGFGSYRTEFLLSIDPVDLRLSGKAEFNGMDGSTMYLDAPLIAVPEPASFMLAAIVGLASLVRGGRSPQR